MLRKIKFPKFKKLKFKKPTKKSLRKIVPAIIVIAPIVWIFWGIPLPTKLSKTGVISTKIFDRNEKLIYEIYANEKRSPLPLTEIPDNIKNATIAVEDKDFYHHYGFSPTGIIRAAYNTIFKQKLEGGSTLTQQLVKNALLSPKRTVRRKIREFILSTAVEIIYSKDKIFESYLNQIPYGGTAYGIEAASELYFNKRVQDLNLAEAALLAGLPAAPTKYSPFGAHPEYAKDRQRTVLRRMVEESYITQEEADAAEKVELVYAKPQNLTAPHFALWIKELLAEKYGDKMVEQGGLRVITTLDLDLQEYAQEIVKKEVDKLKNQNVGNGAALVTRPASGEILAMVGSKDYFAEDEDGKVNIIFAKRQPGSSIKPLNYALALKDGKITASTALADVPTCFTVAGQEPYCPTNYDGAFHGAIQTRFALGNSYNIPAVRVLALNGLEHFVEFAKEMGITTFTEPKNYGLSLTLGGGEVTMENMAVAYGVFANQGIKQPLIPVLKIEDWKGNTLYEAQVNEENGNRVLNSSVTFLISHILLDNNARSAAFGESSYLNVSGHPEVSVKTGTTNDRRDNWTIGYTGQILVASWVGNNDNSEMSGAVSGVSGASPIWNRIIKKALDKAEEGTYNKNDKGHAWPGRSTDIAGMNICANTGTLPGGDVTDCPQRFEYFIKDFLPHEGAFRQDIEIDGVTQNQLVITDPDGTPICLTCPIPTTPAIIRYPLQKL